MKGITQENNLGNQLVLIIEYKANPVNIWKIIAKYIKEYTIPASALIPVDLMGSLQIRRMSIQKT